MVGSVLDSVYRIELPIPFPLKTTNIYLIDDSPRTLIDTGIKTEASFEAFVTGLEVLGFRPQQIERILITHGHIDHYGQAKKLSTISGAPIYIHPKEYGRIRSILHSLGFLKSVLLRNGIPRPLAEEAIRYIESAQKFADPLEEAFFLRDGDPISFQSMTWKAVHCPGHSPGLVCFYWPEKKALFTGDHLLKEITPNPILQVSENIFPFRYPSLREYLSSLKRIQEMDVSLILPGHGETIQDPTELIQKLFTHHRQRAELIAEILSEGEKTAFDIARDLFPGLQAFELFLGFSEVVGHLEILREEGRVAVLEKEGAAWYTLQV